MAEDCSKLVAAEARTLFSHLSWWQASNLTNFSQDAVRFPAHFTLQWVKVKVGVGIMIAVPTCTWSSLDVGHVLYVQDVPLQCPQLDTGKCFMYCTMTKFTETLWSSLFHSVFFAPFLLFPIEILWHTPSEKACLGESHVKTYTVVYLLFIITFSSKVSLGRLLHSSHFCSLYLPSTLIGDRQSYTYILL